jgi:two-component system cell cycle response regulator
LHNEKYFEEALKCRFNRELDSPFIHSVLVARVDFFKELNEKTGRPTGDEIIKWISRRFCDSLRKPDLICRCYGSTFGIVLSETPKDNAIKVGLKLKNLLETEPVLIRDLGLERTMTISVGIFEISEGSPSVETFMIRARETLDETEQQGGNQVVTVLL